MTSFSKPTSSQVNAAVALLSSSNYRAYFMERLTNPNWILPLRKRGLFDHPQATEKIEGGGVRHPYWQESRYLARMAKVAPQEVTDILVNITTDNPSVLRDVLDAASNMLPEHATYAARLVPAICKGIEVDVFEIIYPNAIDFCVQMATSDGQEDAAMTLAEALFALECRPGQGTKRDRESYWYKKGLKQLVPVLVEKRPKEFLEALCRWLCTAIKRDKHDDQETQEDTSWYWRPAIEEHEQNRDYDFPCEMVGFVRQAFEHAIDKERLTLAEGLAVLERQSFTVFRRLQIHLINRFAEQDQDLARSTIMKDRAMLDDGIFVEFKHEYAMLVGERFPMLTQDDRNTWLSWVDEGPDMTWYDEHNKDSSANRETLAADRKDYIRSWQYDRLHWIRKHLSGKWLEMYTEMFDKCGEPQAADLNSWHGSVHWGSESPFTVEELNELSFDKALAKVEAWQPGKTRSFPDDPQKEGLANTFGQYLAGKAEEFSAKAEMLKDMQPIYVRTFLDKMTEVVNTKNIDVGTILRLCAWVVEQPIGQDATVDSVSSKMVDRGWQWSRETVCRFLRTICELESEKRPRYALSDFRDAIRALLDHLTHDQAKSHVVDEKEENSPRVYDFLTSAINSPRGKAVDALIVYARWIAKQVQREENGRKIVPNGFDDMPEVREMLDWQIAAGNASFESFAIIGTYIGLLHWIDPSWVKGNTPKIFDLAVIERDPKHAHGWAAWNAALVWGNPHVELYRMLRPQYIYAVEHLSEAVLPPNTGKTPLHHLGQQLILLYGRGNLEEFNDEQLLGQFLEAAPSDVRSQTIAFVGHSLSDLSDSKKSSEAIVSRFQKLWEWYWPKFGQLDAKARPEGGLFAWWFTSKQFSDDWSLKQLEEFVKVVPIPEFAERIAERLAEIPDAHIETVTRILNRMIRADQEGWRAYAWREPAKKILKSALQGNDTLQGMAIRLIDELGRRGYIEYGDLLTQN
jgi:hypothetical protein